jgi:hypothetical protein
MVQLVEHPHNVAPFVENKFYNYMLKGIVLTNELCASKDANG